MTDDEPRTIPTRPSIRAIAAAAGVSPSTIHRDLQKLASHHADDDGRVPVWLVAGLDGKVRFSRRLDTTDRDNEIVERRRRGQTIREIADGVGCSVGTVHRILTNHLG